MTNIHKHSLVKYFILSLLILSSIAGNYFRFELFFGVDFIFGSIFVIIILNVFGLFWGVLSATLASANTIVLWNHPYAAIIIILEALFLGFALKKKRESNLVTLDLIYWATLGIPLVIVFYYFILKMSYTTTTLIVLKQTVNGILNALVANTFLTCLPQSYLNKFKKRSIKEMLFNGFLACALIPALIFTAIESRISMENIEKQIVKDIHFSSEEIKGLLNHWTGERFNILSQLAKMASGEEISSLKLQDKVTLVKNSFEELSTVYIADETATTIAFEPLVNSKGQSTLGINFSDRDYFRRVKEELRPVVSEAFIGRGGVFEPMVTLSVPIDEKEFKGYVTGSLQLDSVSKMLETGTRDKRVTATVIDNQGRIIASTKKKLMPFAKYVGPEESGNIMNFKSDLLLWQPQDEKLSAMARWDQSYFYLKQPIGSTLPFNLIVKIEAEPYIFAMQQLYIKNFAITIVVTVIYLILANLLSNRIISPLVKLVNQTTNLPEKAFFQMPHSLSQSDLAEIAVLESNFNQMFMNLKEKFKEIKDAKDSLQYMAQHDTLTGLLNRNGFEVLLANLKTNRSNSTNLVAVLYIDIDRFKSINDNLGHQCGDLLLKKVAERIKDVCSSGIVVRQGGDEFLVVLTGLTNSGEPEQVAERIKKSVSKAINIGNEFYVSASIGIAICSEVNEDFERMIQRADYAMYLAKEKGGDCYQIFSKDLQIDINQKFSLENDLRRAIDRNELYLHYQPILDLKNNKVHGVEALVRWKHPEKGNIPPSQFIPVAEETGLIDQIGEWVLITACKEMKTLHDKGFNKLRVAVNISSRQFLRGNVIQLLDQTLKCTKLDPEFLELELTESTLMTDVQSSINTLHEIKKMGIKIALDDFGTGYSSLNYLEKFPVDSIKIDKSFVDLIPEEPRSVAIANAILSLAKSLNLSIVAEGVETKKQYDFFVRNECDEVQGYLISKPLSTLDVESFLCDASFL